MRYAHDRSRCDLRLQGKSMREIDDLLGPPDFLMGKQVVLRRDHYDGPHEPERRPTKRNRQALRLKMDWLQSEELSPLDQLIQREEQQ